LLAGAAHVSDAVVLPPKATTFWGGPGTVLGITELLMPAAPVPAALVAVTENV
jgi:hypothetical protein